LSHFALFVQISHEHGISGVSLQGLKKSVFLSPEIRNRKLSQVLEKYCALRDMKLEDYIATDLNGEEVSLETLVKDVTGGEVGFFTKKSM
jgi:hypothetical protein